jgi:hypothetical protein
MLKLLIGELKAQVIVEPPHYNKLQCFHLSCIYLRHDLRLGLHTLAHANMLVFSSEALNCQGEHSEETCRRHSDVNR